MHIIARPAINQAIRRHADAANWLNAWWKVAGGQRWRSLLEVRACRVTYANQWQRGTLLVKHFLTHAEYDRQDWKEDCQ
jgi:mRNA-degrading endonuclease HigB of HigAB toxin-antitoxin module